MPDDDHDQREWRKARALEDLVWWARVCAVIWFLMFVASTVRIFVVA